MKFILIKRSLIFSLLFSSCLSIELKAQTDDGDIVKLTDLSLEELMNIKILSASKEVENVFEAPLAAYVVSADEIRNSGSASILDALRLVPGLVVREQTNGNFDVHVRGLDNVPPNSVFPNAANTTTLVMIDNRPVYSYLQGGTFWETLPVDLHDIDRIEVIQGPSSAMYGPNAVSGVIHIITRKVNKDGWQGQANLRQGIPNMTLAGASIGYKWNEKLQTNVSGNYQYKKRFEDTYLHIESNTWLKAEDFDISSMEQRYPEPTRAMDKYGVNGFLNYKPNYNTELNLSGGLQSSEVQNIYQENLSIPLSNSKSKSMYMDLNGAIGNLTTQLSYLAGTQDPSTGVRGAKYDFVTTDAWVEYKIKFNNISIKPGLNFRQALYDDTKYWDETTMEGSISGKREIYTYAFSLRGDYRLLNDKLRLSAAGRLDKFNHPEDVYPSYQLSSSYKINKNNLVRVVYSRANRSPFIYDTYLELQIKTVTPMPVPGTDFVFPIPTDLQVLGNKELKLVTSDMAELGYRKRLADNLDANMEIFYIRSTNFTEMIHTNTGVEVNPPNPIPTKLSATYQVLNLPVSVQQVGATVSANYVSGKYQIKPFITFQSTHLDDYSSYTNTSNVAPSPINPDPQTNNLYSGVGSSVKHKGTPSYFGGAYINYQPIKKVIVNVTTYYFGESKFYHRNNTQYRDGVRGVANLESKVLLNASLSYSPIKPLTIQVSGRNLLGDNAREFYGGERIGSSVIAGVSLNL